MFRNSIANIHTNVDTGLRKDGLRNLNLITYILIQKLHTELMPFSALDKRFLVFLS